jgi:hypothetical protein
VTAMLCITAGTKAFQIAVMGFTLAWTHSVERTAWQEDWRIEDHRLLLVQSRVKGSGAGMEPGPGAVLRDGFWQWRPALAPVSEIVLARSGATADWSFCVAGSCRSMGELVGSAGDPVRLGPCESVLAEVR